MRFLSAVLSGAVLLAAGGARAQVQGPPDPGAADSRVTELIDQAQRLYGTSDPRDRCRRRGGEEIVVCVDRGEDLRVPSTADSDPASREARHAQNNGIPRAPQLDRGSCRGQPGCVVGGRTPPQIYEVDVSALPQAPEGSDADLVARGELAPR